jgi:hypothetical protein
VRHAKQSRLRTDLAAALQRRATALGAVEQMLVLPENAGRLNSPRVMKRAENS